jgi:hypothetical protein
METLSATIRERHPQEDSCDDIDTALRELAARKVPEIDGYLLSPVASLPSRVADLLQLGTRRTIDLAESAIRELNLQQVNSSCVLARAVLETCCLMLYVSEEIRQTVQEPYKADFDRLSKFAINMLVGSGQKAKTFYFMEGFVVTNILTIFEKLDKKLETPFIEFYEGLSEHAHPNAHGMALMYAQTHKVCVTTYTDRKESQATASLSLAIHALASALQIAEMANRHWKEDCLQFTLLAENDIHENGTWPKDIPYPIPRRSDGTFQTSSEH